MKVTPLDLEGLLLLEPTIFGDDRGFFLESYNLERYQAAGISDPFVQDNHSRAVQGTLRGLHFQTRPGQGKLMRVTRGKIFDVAVDIRPDSPTFGRWSGCELDAESHRQLWVPVGFAHGFCVLSDVAEVLYKVTSVYNPETEKGFRWDDPTVGVEWPVEAPLLSERDQNAPTFEACQSSFVRS